MITITTPAELSRALRARDRAAINTAARKLLEQRTRLGQDWLSVAQVLVRNGEAALAVAAANRGVEESRNSPEARFKLAYVLSTVGRQQEAIELVSALPPGAINPVRLDHFLGVCAMERGDFELARCAFERVVAAWPGSGPSWLSLAALPATDDGKLLERLETAASAVGAESPDLRAQWHYAKGTVLDRLGRADEAFSEFAAGAELARSGRTYDPAADASEAETLSTDFTRESVEGTGAQVTVDTSRPILVTGLPRSGTTLVEQILTSHSAIAGGGEMPFADVLAREIGGNSAAGLEAFAAKHGLDRLAELYLHLGAEQFGEEQRFVDKYLGTTRTLGLLASVLPQARIIWVRRDPLDCAWSCFRTFFTQRLDWSWALADIAAHFQAEDRLRAHWADVLGERMLTLSYEALVADPETETKRILGHVGLEPEATTSAPHRSRRAVTTASLAQVREPIYRTAVGSAAPYRAHLKPFLEAYGAASAD